MKSKALNYFYIGLFTNPIYLKVTAVMHVNKLLQTSSNNKGK